MKKSTIAYSYYFQKMFLTKDVYLIPYYIAKESTTSLEYYYSENLGDSPMSGNYRNSKIKFRNYKIGGLLTLLLLTLRRARSSFLLFLNGSSAKHMLMVWLYKKMNPSGKVIVFGDMEAPQARELNANGFIYSKGILGFVKNKLTNYFFQHVLYLVANTEAYSIMKNLFDRKGWKGLLNFYPCLDDELAQELGVVRKPLKEKDNIIICVGRIGNNQKNTDMLLSALENVDLKDWKIYMIGPITSSFNLREQSDYQSVIDDFFSKHPQFKDKLIFTGMITDPKEMLEFYSRAKVLLSTARHEGFANVYSQAAAFGCYVVSTDVGGADVGSNYWKYGTKIEQEDVVGLSRVLNELVQGKIQMDPSKSIPMEDITYSNRIKNILIPALEAIE